MYDKHVPVLLEESLVALNIKPDGIYVDATFGRGGHSKAILDKLGPKGKLIIIDKDPSSISIANKIAANDNRLISCHGSYADIKNFISKLDLIGKVNGVLADLGVSSFQLDTAERGFSFMSDGPLDMRMDPTSDSLPAKDWINNAELDEIKRVLKVYGEEKCSAKIARAICESRIQKPITTTKELADLIYKTIGKREKHKHPATRSFQAIRIYINQELEDLECFLAEVESVLAPSARLAIISFHSLEDRIVKQFIQDKTKVKDNFPKNLPIKHDMLIQPNFTKIGKFIIPSDLEIDNNVRSRSSKLRIIEKN